MRIQTDLFEFEIPSSLQWLDHEIGFRLRRRVKGFEQQERHNPLLGRYYRETFPLEFALAEACSQLRKTAIFLKSDRYNQAYAFAATTKRISEVLPEKAASLLISRLKGAMNDEYGFRPTAFELGIFTHLVRKGYDVSCVDLTGINRFDLLAVRNGTELEVECKTTSADTGRKIHRPELNRLTHYLLPTTKRLVEEGGCHLVRLTLPDRLERDERYLKRLGSLVAKSVEGVPATSDEGRAEYRTLSLKSWPPPHEFEGVARSVLNDVFGAENHHRHFVCHHYAPRQGFGIVAIESQKPDTVLQTIVNQAKGAADQCTGTRPALILVQLVEIDLEELRVLLDTPSGIHFIAHEVFKNDARSHIDSLVFSLPPEIQTRDVGAPVAVIHNPSPRIPSVEAREVFRN
jgi:hypothetical protein